MSEELDDLLNEMLLETELASQQEQQQQKRTTFNDNNTTTGGISTSLPNNNNNTLSEKRKSRLSQHLSGGFDYLDTLLNDMSNESIRNSIKQDNSRIKSLRLTSTYDLETTLKDLEETFSNPSLSQHKRKPSSFLSKLSTTQPPPSSQPTTRITSNKQQQPQPSTQPNNTSNNNTSVPPISIPPKQPVITNKQLQQPEQQSLSSSQQMKSSFKVSETTEMAHILTKEAIDAADLLDQMIESFGGLPPTPTMTSTNSTNSINNTNSNSNGLISTTSPRSINTKSPNSTVRGMKLGTAVDIQVNPSPKAPTPIATLSSPPLQSNSGQPNPDRLLDDMISSFKESTANIKTSGISHSTNGTGSTIIPQHRPVFNQQNYTMTPEEQQLMQHHKPQSVDEDLISKILGDNDIDVNSMSQTSISKENKSNSSNSNIDASDKVWYIKPPATNDEKNNILGSGNHGTSCRAGIHKDKRVVCKSWNFITPQGTPQLFHEIEQLVAIKHPNILPLVGASFNNNFMTFTEYITANNLDIVFKGLDEQNELSTIIRVSEEIASAMSFLHSFNIVHRSLHPKNILLNSDLKVYIKDFGFTSLKDETLRKKLNSPLSNQLKHSQYLAPELYNVILGSKGGYDTKVDVFSFGVLLWEMFARDVKLSDLKSNTINGYTHYLRSSLDNCPFTIEKLIRLCISTDPLVRPTFQTILKILRQPLHTLQRYNKPVNSFINSDDSNNYSSNNDDGGSSKKDRQLDSEKVEKISKIFTICQGFVEEPTLANLNRAAITLESVCKNKENHPYLLDVQLLPLVFQIMENPYEDLQILCLKIINHIVEDDELSEIFRNLLGINILIQSLSSRNENILFTTLRILCSLCHKDNNRLEVMTKGGVGKLIQLLQSQNESVKLQVIWCISLLLDSQIIQNEFVQLGGVQLLVDMFVFSKDSGFDLRLASALSNVLSIKSVQDQINNGNYRERMVKKYIGLLGDNDFETLRMLGLEALSCLVSNKENQNLLINDDVITLFSEYLQLDAKEAAPQMTAIKIILTLALNDQNLPYLNSKDFIIPSLKTLLTSPHPSIQKASEKLLNLLK